MPASPGSRPRSAATAIITAWQMLWLDPGAGARRAALSRRTPGARDLGFQDAEPGKIMHETPQGRDGGAGGDPVRPLLRRRRHHAAVRRAGRRLLRPHRRSRADRRALAGAEAALRLDRTRAGDSNGDGFCRLRARRRRPASPTRAGRTARTSSSTPTAASRPARSRWSRCRATPTPPSQAMAELAERRGECGARRSGARAPRRCAGGSSSASGWRSAGFYGIAIDGDGRALPRASPPTPAICCSAACRRAERARRVTRQLLSAALQQRLGPAHAGHRRSALQPDVLPQRLGLAARHGALRRRHGALRRARRGGAAARRPVRGGRRSSACAARAVLRLPPRAPASRRSPIRSPACRRPGRPARCS